MGDLSNFAAASARHSSFIIVIIFRDIGQEFNIALSRTHVHINTHISK